MAYLVSSAAAGCGWRAAIEDAIGNTNAAHRLLVLTLPHAPTLSPLELALWWWCSSMLTSRGPRVTGTLHIQDPVAMLSLSVKVFATKPTAAALQCTPHHQPPPTLDSACACTNGAVGAHKCQCGVSRITRKISAHQSSKNSFNPHKPNTQKATSPATWSFADTADTKKDQEWYNTSFCRHLNRKLT